ncbi:MAG: DUF5063 domain-containing protein [Bacteroidales bacterium]
MTNRTSTDATSSASVLDMFTVANEFCIFTEKAEKYDPVEVLAYYAKICPLLYLKGALLPVLEPDEDYFGERFVNEDQWENIYNSLLIVLSDKDSFYTLSYENADNIPLKASIAEHLTDIYQDLKDFVLLYQKNLAYAKQNAIYECRKLFIAHWGLRIASLLPALHAVAFPVEQDEEFLF